MQGDWFWGASRRIADGIAGEPCEMEEDNESDNKSNARTDLQTF